MSDYTDDDTPRERYEGPMATKAKAETVTWGGCGGAGRHVWRMIAKCPKCNGTGIESTGEVVDAGFMPLDEAGAVFRCRSAECGALAFRRELQSDGSCKCGASVHRLDGVLADQYRTIHATIAEQAAEIERLTKERDTHLCPLCHGTGMVGNVNDREACERCEGTGIDAYTEMIAELTTNRDALRLEVLRLNDLKCEAMDRYAALEAERDALKRAIDAAMRTIAAQSSTLFEDWP